MPHDDLARAEREERLRQVREAFDQRRDHDARWFAFRIAMGRATLVALLIVCAVVVVSIVMLLVGLKEHRVDAKTVLLTVTGLVSALGGIGSISRLVLTREPRELKPVVQVDEDPRVASGTPAGWPTATSIDQEKRSSASVALARLFERDRHRE